MLPGVLQSLVAVMTTVVLAVCGLGQLARYQLAQSDSSNVPAPESRSAGLAFAERALWTPDAWSGRISAEYVPAFAEATGTVSVPYRATMVPGEGTASARAVAALGRGPELPDFRPMLAASTRPVASAAIAASVRIAALPDPVSEPVRDGMLRPAAMPPRLVLASLSTPLSSELPVHAALVERAPAPADERGPFERIRPDRDAAQPAHAIAGPVAALIMEAPALSASEVQLPRRRPRAASLAERDARAAAKQHHAESAKKKASSAKKKEAHKRPRKLAHKAHRPAARPPAAVQPAPQTDPFTELFTQTQGVRTAPHNQW